MASTSSSKLITSRTTMSLCLGSLSAIKQRQRNKSVVVEQLSLPFLLR